MKYGDISESMNAGRIVSKGKIESFPFALPFKHPFSLYIRPKEETTVQDVLVNLKCYQEGSFSQIPVALYDWSPLAIREIGSNPGLLENYDLYWGSGTCEEY